MASAAKPARADSSSTARVAGTKRSTGAWSQESVGDVLLRPEVETEIPWVPPEKFRALVHEAGAEQGFGSQHDVKRPDLVIVERGLALDRLATRRRMILGVAFGVVGLLTLALALLYIATDISNIVVFVLLSVVGSGFAVSGLTLATESRWQSDIIRVRVDPNLTRIRVAGAVRQAPQTPLRLFVFQGRVSSSSSSSKAGTFRSLLSVLSTSDRGVDTEQFAARLREIAPLEAVRRSRTSPLAVSRQPPDPNLLPAESDSSHPVWYAYPKNIGWVRVTVMIFPLMFLIFGPMALALPWDYQNVSYHVTSPGVKSIPMEPWSPTGATWGELS